MRGALKIALLLCFAFACKPKDVTPAEEPAPPATPDTGLTCKEIPPPSTVFGWHDSVTNINHNILAFVFNPVNSNEVICLVQGDLNNYNELFTFDLVSRKKTILGNLGDYPPSVNQRGWITYSSIDNNIYIVKSNGDSSAKLTTNNLCENPRWDYTGKRIYYYQKPYFNVGSNILRLNLFNTTGSFMHPASGPQLAMFNRSHKMLYLHNTNSKSTIVLRDNDSLQEQAVITRTFSASSGMPFNNLSLDQTDESFCWSDTRGIYKCSLKTMKVDTLLKNCPNFNYRNPLMSYRLNELTVTKHIITPLKNDILLHTYKALEVNLFSNKTTEIRIFQ